MFRAKHRQTCMFKHFFRQKVISLQFCRGGSFRGPAATHPSRQNLKVSFVGGSRPALRRPTRRTNTQTHTQTNTQSTLHRRRAPLPNAPRDEISRSGALTLITTGTAKYSIATRLTIYCSAIETQQQQQQPFCWHDILLFKTALNSLLIE